jgi:hypothetical protein
MRYVTLGSWLKGLFVFLHLIERPMTMQEMVQYELSETQRHLLAAINRRESAEALLAERVAQEEGLRKQLDRLLGDVEQGRFRPNPQQVVPPHRDGRALHVAAKS